MADISILSSYFPVWVLMLTIATKTQAQPSWCISNIEVSSPSPTSILVTWSLESPENCPAPVNDINIHYFLRNRDHCEIFEMDVLQGSVDSTPEIRMVLINELYPFSWYIIWVQYLPNPVDDTQWNTTEGDITGKPTNIQAGSISHNSLKFTWEEVPCGQRGADINMYRTRLIHVNDDLEMLGTTEDLSFEFKGLSPNTTYEFQIQAQAGIDGEGVKSGPYSEPLRIRTMMANETVEEPVQPETSSLVLIIAISISSVCLLLIVAGVSLVYCKKKKKLLFSTHSPETYALPIRIDLLPEEEYDALQNISFSRESSEYEVSWKNLKVSKTLLGEGKFGKVKEGSVRFGKKWVRVAIKSIQSDTFEEDIRGFDNELKMMKTIGRHVNIVSLVGACKHKGMLYVALEYVSHGDLRHFLQNSRIPPQQDGSEFSSSLSARYLIGLALDVAKGMNYLSSKGIIHRDLAARNVLVAGGHDVFVAKISDFGLSRGDFIYEQAKLSRSLIPVKWTAPEAFSQQLYTTKSDVWSFGILVWEIVTFGGSPYSRPKIRNTDIQEFLQSGKRMDKPPNCDTKLYDTMMACWRLNPRQRPTFDVLVNELTYLHLDEGKAYVITKIGGDTFSFIPIDDDRDDDVENQYHM